VPWCPQAASTRTPRIPTKRRRERTFDGLRRSDSSLRHRRHRPYCSPWAVPGHRHWVHAHVRTLDHPIPCRGLLNLSDRLRMLQRRRVVSLARGNRRRTAADLVCRALLALGAARHDRHGSCHLGLPHPGVGEDRVHVGGSLQILQRTRPGHDGADGRPQHGPGPDRRGNRSTTSSRHRGWCRRGTQRWRLPMSDHRALYTDL
jgi:hypothetical protein